MVEVTSVSSRRGEIVKKLAGSVLVLVLCGMALTVSPPPAEAHCHENCCAQAQQDVEGYCSYSYVTYFHCIEGYMGSCCAVWYDCAPPWV